MKFNKLSIIGCGNIGRRHLQAALSLNKRMEVSLFDNSKDALKETRTFIKNLDFDKKKYSLNFLDSYDDVLATAKDSVFCIATTAKKRHSIVKDALGSGAAAIFAEKPLTQSYDEYKSLLENKNIDNCKIYINFPRHMWPAYRKFYSRIIKNDLFGSVSVSCLSRNLAIACNGIHYIELACWLSEAKDYVKLSGKINKTTIPSKRGNEFMDFTGNLFVEFDNGANLYFNSMEEGVLSSVVHVQHKEDSLTYWEELGLLAESSSDKEINFAQQNAPFVSFTSQKIIDDLLTCGKTSDLPDIVRAALPHRILFDFLERYLDPGILKIKDKVFPIT